jgi:hypothetical protein
MFDRHYYDKLNFIYAILPLLSLLTNEPFEGIDVVVEDMAMVRMYIQAKGASSPSQYRGETSCRLA